MSLPGGGAPPPGPTREAPPPRPPSCFVSGFGVCTNIGTTSHPSRASGIELEAVPGPAQFKLR
eukprot:14290003-Alexandrium_andersonii.AAC.1